MNSILRKNLELDESRVLDGGNIGLSKLEDGDKYAVMIVFPTNVIYRFETEEEMEEIIESQFIHNQVCEKYLVHAEKLTEMYMKFYGDVSFFNKQSRIL